MIYSLLWLNMSKLGSFIFVAFQTNPKECNEEKSKESSE